MSASETPLEERTYPTTRDLKYELKQRFAKF